MALFSEEAIIILAPPEYLNGLSVINILCICFAISFFSKQPQLMYAGKTVIQSVLSFINFICNIIVLYVFVNKFGIIGAAVGVLIVTVIYNSLLVWQGQKYFKIEYEWLKLAVIYSMLIFMSISVALFLDWEIAYFNRLIIKIIYLGIFIGFGIYLKIMTRNNLLLILNKNKPVKI